MIRAVSTPTHMQHINIHSLPALRQLREGGSNRTLTSSSTILPISMSGNLSSGHTCKPTHSSALLPSTGWSTDADCPACYCHCMPQ